MLEVDFLAFKSIGTTKSGRPLSFRIWGSAVKPLKPVIKKQDKLILRAEDLDNLGIFQESDEVHVVRLPRPVLCNGIDLTAFPHNATEQAGKEF